jgi:transketolase
MGATHHALGDIGALRALPNIRLYVPLVAADIEDAVRSMAADPLPNYLRLNAPAELPDPVPAFAAWRKLKPGPSAVVIGMGPIMQGLYELSPELFDKLELWSVGVFPLESLPEALCASIREKRRVITIEEHYLAGGLGEALCQLLLTSGVVPRAMTCLHAAGYPSGRYGSQRWHQEESGLRGPALVSCLEKLLRD